jgi:hypothetical protein
VLGGSVAYRASETERYHMCDGLDFEHGKSRKTSICLNEDGARGRNFWCGSRIPALALAPKDM